VPKTIVFFLYLQNLLVFFFVLGVIVFATFVLEKKLVEFLKINIGKLFKFYFLCVIHLIFLQNTSFQCFIGKLLVFFFFLPSFNYCLRSICEVCGINSFKLKDSRS